MIEAVPPTPQASQARVISVCAVSPGSGRSTIAGNLAFEIAARGSRVCLLDLDDQRPSLHRLFSLPQQQASVMAGARYAEQGRLDANTFEQISVRLVAKGVGVDLISGYGLNLNPEGLSLEGLEGLIEFLAQRFDFLVVDAPADLGSKIQAVIHRVETHRVLVVLADPINLGRLLESSATSEASAPNTLVLNRLRSSVLGARPEWQVQQLLNQRTSFQAAVVIPEDAAFDQALMNGLPLRQLAGKSKALKGIAGLANRIAPAGVAQ